MVAVAALGFVTPVGWAALAAASVVAVGAIGIGAISEVMKARARARYEGKSETKPKVVAQTRTCKKVGAKQNCTENKYGLRVHAQGSDIGGTSKSTKGLSLDNQAKPFIVVQGITLSNAVWAILEKGQREIRLKVKEKLENYIRSGPVRGGLIGKKSYAVKNIRGGIRYDIDIFGGRSFLA